MNGKEEEKKRNEIKLAFSLITIVDMQTESSKLKLPFNAIQQYNELHSAHNNLDSVQYTSS